MVFKGVSPNWIKVLLFLVATFLISSCTSMQRGYQAAGKSDEAVLENIDAMRAVEIANEWKWTHKDVKTSIDSREAIFEFPDGKVKRIALPEDKMYIAIAPYIKKTHTWTIHVPSSCQGELTEKTFHVKAVDQAGNVLVDGDVATLKNGFFELWLSRNRKISLTIQYSGLTAKGMIETFATSKTCVTTFQLQ